MLVPPAMVAFVLLAALMAGCIWDLPRGDGNCIYSGFTRWVEPGVYAGLSVGRHGSFNVSVEEQTLGTNKLVEGSPALVDWVEIRVYRNDTVDFNFGRRQLNDSQSRQVVTEAFQELGLPAPRAGPTSFNWEVTRGSGLTPPCKPWPVAGT